MYLNRILTVTLLLTLLVGSGCKKDEPSPQGRNWTKVSTPTSSVLLNAFPVDNTGIIAGEGIFLTTNGGTSFTKVFTAPSGKSFLSVDFIDANNAIASGLDIIYKSTDGGASWAAVAPPASTGTYWSIHFRDAQNGLVAEGSGKVYQTTDGGDTWTNPASIATPPLINVQFFDAQTAFASGGQGAIIKTTDGGSTWSTVPYTSSEVVGVYFVTANIGFTYEHNGKIKRTDDGGATWVAQNSGVTTAIRAMAFISSQRGFAVGDNGVILSTGDGATWVKETSGTTELLNSITIGSTFVYVSGSNGVLLKAPF